MVELDLDSADIFNRELIFNLGEVGRRIRSVRSRYDLSQSEFAARLHISRKWLSELENGKKCPSGLLLLGMECRYAISSDWVLAGKGPMFVCSEWDEKSAETVIFLKAFNKLSKMSREKLSNILNIFLFIEENEDKSSRLCL
jgi:transcriptional regulator with XRE-family HTH domain